MINVRFSLKNKDVQRGPVRVQNSEQLNSIALRHAYEASL